VTQRIPLRIDLTPAQPIVTRLRAGMSVTTRIDTRG
jgi:membrane fusion protein (multidrug efflux system)